MDPIDINAAFTWAALAVRSQFEPGRLSHQEVLVPSAPTASCPAPRHRGRRYHHRRVQCYRTKENSVLASDALNASSEHVAATKLNDVHALTSNFSFPSLALDELGEENKENSVVAASGPNVSLESDVTTKFDSATYVHAVSSMAILPTRELGDIVRVHGSGTPAEFRCKVGIVTAAHENHCTVTMLSDDLRWGIGQIWPSHHDTELIDTSLRVGSRVVLQGIVGKDAVLNGKAAKVIVSKHMHPAFMKKPSGASLCVCVKLDAKLEGRSSSLILEPSHLLAESAWDPGFHNAKSLDEVVTSLQSLTEALFSVNATGFSTSLLRSA